MTAWTNPGLLIRLRADSRCTRRRMRLGCNGSATRESASRLRPPPQSSTTRSSCVASRLRRQPLGVLPGWRLTPAGLGSIPGVRAERDAESSGRGVRTLMRTDLVNIPIAAVWSHRTSRCSDVGGYRVGTENGIENGAPTEDGRCAVAANWTGVSRETCGSPPGPFSTTQRRT
jgi:hypothetical protein